MTEINKEIEEMAEVIRRARQELRSGLILPEETATALFNAGYRKQSDTVKEFAEKLLSPLIGSYNQAYKASGYDMEAAARASELKHYIDHIKHTSEQFGVEGNNEIWH